MVFSQTMTSSDKLSELNNKFKDIVLISMRLSWGDGLSMSTCRGRLLSANVELELQN